MRARRRLSAAAGGAGAWRLSTPVSCSAAGLPAPPAAPNAGGRSCRRANVSLGLQRVPPGMVVPLSSGNRA